MKQAGARFLVASEDVVEKLGGRPNYIDTLFLIGDSMRSIMDRSVAPVDLTSAVIPFDQALSQPTLPGLVLTPPKEDDLASIVFTSGTTGGAKGVMLTHRNFLANVSSLTRAISVGFEDRLLLVLPLHHAFALTVGLLTPMAVGGQVILEKDFLRVPQRFLETRPTVFLGVPAIFEAMDRAISRRLEREGKATAYERGLALVRQLKDRPGLNAAPVVFHELRAQLGGKLRFMVSGGSALDPNLARRLLDIGVPVLQGWGLTEASPVVTFQRWSPWRFYMTDYYEKRAGSVGQPLPEVEVRLIDVPEKGLFATINGEGELVVRGPNVSPGYWQAEESTSAAKMDGWFRTGDIGRIDSEGNVWITGRSKYVIVLDSGEKVHPDEVEGVLARSIAVRDVCVRPVEVEGRVQVSAVIYPSIEGSRLLCQRFGLTFDTAGVTNVISRDVQRLGSELALYKRPRMIVLADEPLPKTPLGKVARYRLKDVYEFDQKRWLGNENASGAAI
jgi:long-chain acyl-CoA synthetase